MEATPPAMAGEEAAPAAAVGATAGAPSAVPAAEDVAAETPVEAATAGAAAAEVAGAPALEVVYGRYLLSSPVEVPLPWLLIKAQRAMEEAEAGFRREWEMREAEHLWLSDWERRLGDHIQVVASRTTEERAQLEQEREIQREKMRKVIDREIAVVSREKAVALKEMEVE
jgi:hypothetical protein